jgi:hypothetical protein
MRSTTIIDGVDLIRRLEKYIENDYLKATTQLCTMLPQEKSLDNLTEFLLQYGYHKVNGVPLDAIGILARIVITKNVFIYGKKFYRQVIGGAMGSPFSLTLANIFMWKWEKALVQRQFFLIAAHLSYIFIVLYVMHSYIDDIFFTSNVR